MITPLTPSSKLKSWTIASSGTTPVSAAFVSSRLLVLLSVGLVELAGMLIQRKVFRTTENDDKHSTMSRANRTRPQSLQDDLLKGVVLMREEQQDESNYMLYRPISM
jgi:hypothetical protein